MRQSFPFPPCTQGARGSTYNRLMETRIRQAFSTNREMRFTWLNSDPSYFFNGSSQWTLARL